MCVCIHTHTCVEHTEVQAYGGQRSVSFCCSYFLRQGFWWNMDGTHDSDRLAGHWSAEMRLLSPMPQHCGYRWVLPPWLLYECWGPEFRPHANAVSPSPGEPSLQLVLSFLILNVFILKVIYTDKFNILTTLKLFFAMSPWNQHRCATPLCEAESLLPIPAGSSDHTSLTLLHVFPQRNHHSVSLISLTSLGQF